MSVTYNDILNEMETEFFEECNEYAQEYPDIELRFKAVASEIYAAYTSADFALRQAFVQTASSDYLDMHAEMRGIERKTASPASGTLTFYVPQELESNVDIPKGTICSVTGEPLIQFSTNEAAVITPGSLSVQVPATALASGEKFNAPAGSVTVMVNPPEYVSAVTNENAFTGGTDEESDEMLRKRLLTSYSSAGNGVNAEAFEEQILKIDEITDVRVAMEPDLMILTVWLRTKSGKFPDMNITNEIADILGVLNICSIQYGFTMAHESEFSVFAAVKAQSGADKEKLAADVEASIRNACSACRIGEPLNVSSITAAVCALDNVQLAEISADPSAEGTIACGAGDYLVLKNVQVELYE